jgi:7,8-dihydropterin-6-yl-methyl-4-(beta-D-ribofuranosyl)aminobenzene 5'-phosphate synthase
VLTPGIVEIVKKAKQMLNKDVYLVLGGFHLLELSDSQVQRIIQQLRDLGVRKVGPSHCTGDRAIELFKQEYREDFVPIGVGRISIPGKLGTTTY